MASSVWVGSFARDLKGCWLPPKGRRADAARLARNNERENEEHDGRAGHDQGVQVIAGGDELGHGGLRWVWSLIGRADTEKVHTLRKILKRLPPTARRRPAPAP